VEHQQDEAGLCWQSGFDRSAECRKLQKMRTRVLYWKR